MSLIDELLQNDSTTLTESKKEPISTKFIPEVNNDRFSIDDIEEIENETFNTFADNEPLNNEPTAEFINDSFDDIEINELSEQEKKRNLLFAEMRVQMFTIAGSMACQFLSGQWGEEYESKYTPSKSKQKELAKCIAEVMNIEMKVKNPRTTMYEMFAVVFAPLLFQAGQIGFRNKKNKKEQAKMQVIKTYAQPQQPQQPQEENNFNSPLKKVDLEPEKQSTKFEYIDEKQTAEVEKVIPAENKVNKPKKETRGRKKGSKRNPENNKMEQPYKIENGLMYYSWGETKKVKK